MRIRVYFRIEGDSGDLQNFNSSLSAELSAELRQRKKNIKGQVHYTEIYWCSIESDVEKQLDDLSGFELYIDKIIDIYFDYIQNWSSVLKPTLAMSVIYEHGEEVGGIYLSQKTIKRLSEINCDLDMDADLYKQ